MAAEGHDHARIYQAGRDLHVGHAPVARSGYRYQVERLAPTVLRDRDAELAELAAFCTAADGPPYAWWRAGPWAGKSALLSWFALHPPPGVRLVPFFVTARFAGSSDRGAFLDVLSVQLAELLGEPAPTGLPEAVREGALLDQLDRAAARCAERGGRLVLLVDGLDEDRGVRAGPDAHSIAALLPARPAHGMRVLVAGRPNPPIPGDVPDRHPLRDPAAIRELAASPHAEAVRHDANRELRRLLDGTDLQRDLLGLLTAAVGGLGGADLAELTGADQWEVEEHLHTVSGRTFLTQASRWRPEDGPQVYVLGHEELQQSARHYLGPVRLAGYRERLHGWAEGYRRRGWPEKTPEYLLRGWFRLLRATGDVDRMVACGTDAARHDRMLDLSGGDVTALEEIAVAHEALLTRDEPDLVAMARLAVHRDRMTDRNRRIPEHLPGVWAALGQVERADALLRSILAPPRRAMALGHVMTALAARGSIDRAEQLARDIADGSQLDEILLGLASAAAERGGLVHAERIVGSMSNPGADAWRRLARATLVAGDLTGGRRLAGRALRAASDLPYAGSRAHQGATLVPLLLHCGYWAAGERVAERLDAEARVATDRAQRGEVVIALAEALAKLGAGSYTRDRLPAVVDRAVASAPSWRLPALAGTLAGGGWYELAERVVAASQTPRDQVRVLARMVEAAPVWSDAAAERIDRMRMLTDTLRAGEDRSAALRDVADAVAAHGDEFRALNLARLLSQPSERIDLWCRLGQSLQRAGQSRRAYLAAAAAIRLLPLVDDAGQRRAAGRGMLRLLVACGRPEEATTLASAVEESDERADALALVAAELARAGDPVTAGTLARQAEAAYAAAAGGDGGRSAVVAGVVGLAAGESVDRSLAVVELAPSTEDRAWALVGLARWCAATGGPELADTLARRARQAAGQIRDRRDRGLPLTVLLPPPPAPPPAVNWDPYPTARSVHDPDAGPLLRRLEEDPAPPGLVDQAEAVTRAVSDPDDRDQALAVLTGLLGRAGEMDRAERLAAQIEDRRIRAEALTALTRAATERGATDRAQRLAGSIDEGHSIDEEYHGTWALTALAETLAQAGAPDRAEAVIRSISADERGDAVGRLAEALARHGHPGRAEQLARSIPERHRQAKALTAVAGWAPPAQARRLLAAALHLGGWTISSEVLARVEPAAGLAVADEYFALTGASWWREALAAQPGPDTSGTAVG
ncbi:hypothetical protein GA0070564_102173 [Micromonospora mirobrigensis]|uniref:Uncharacterized protein n=2 Tax=Micromonospora mirobrigensis TaxID=262898 RepID=A0A1C4WCS9_9ACTN|nr:hypothetical protein GA0070564_102173 [Micromonospora mirobrigensis]